MKLKPLCLLLLAVVACAAAQSEDDIPVENDNQFPPDNISEPEGSVLNEPEGIVDDITTQPSDQPADDSTLSTTEAGTLSTEAPNTDITIETSISSVGDTQPTTQEDVVAPEDQITSDTTEASVDEVDGLAVTEITGDITEASVDEVDGLAASEITSDITEASVDEVDGLAATAITSDIAEASVDEVDGLAATEITSDTSEASVDEVDGLAATEITGDTTEASVDEEDGLIVTEISTSDEPVNEDVTTETSTPLIEDVPSPDLDVQKAIEEATSIEPVETVSTEPTVTQAEEVQLSTTELDVATSEIDTPGEPIDADTTDLRVAVDQDQGEPIDTATTESISLGEDGSFPTIVNETDEGASNDSAIGVALFSVLLTGDEQLPTTEVNLKETSEVGTSTESLLDVTTEPSVPLTVDEQLAKNNLQPTQTNEESLNDGATVTPVSPIDPSEFSIRSNKARNDLEAISPLTLAEAPKEVVAPQEVDLPKDTKADNKVEDVSVGATTSVNKAAGVDKSVIGVIVAGMVVVVAGITIKKNWKSIKNKFSSSPRPANDRTNHTNGITPEEVPLQDKDNKNPSPV